MSNSQNMIETAEGIKAPQLDAETPLPKCLSCYTPDGELCFSTPIMNRDPEIKDPRKPLFSKCIELLLSILVLLRKKCVDTKLITNLLHDVQVQLNLATITDTIINVPRYVDIVTTFVMQRVYIDDGRERHAIDFLLSDETLAFNDANFSKVRYEVIKQIKQIDPEVPCESRQGGCDGIDRNYYEIEVPFWFMIALENAVRSSTCIYTDKFSIEELISVISTMKFCPQASFDPTPMVLGRDLNTQIQKLALERKREGHKTQIENLKNAIRNLGDADTHNNKRIERLKAEIEFSTIAMQSIADRLFAIDQTETPPSMVTRPCMEAETDVPQSVDHSANTGIADTAIEPTAHVTDIPQTVSLIAELTADEVHAYGDLTTRWQKIRSFNLDTTVEAGRVFQLHLPADFLQSNWDSPNCLPFRTHEFFAGGMEIKLQWNIPKTNQFHVKIGFVPFWLQRDRREELLEFGPVSQQPGGHLHGHVSDSTVIDIPFMSYTPAIPIRPNRMMLNQYYATLNIKAFTNFQVSSGSTTSAELNCYLKFKNDLRFYGLRQIQDALPPFNPPAPMITRPQMLATLGAIASTKLLGAAEGVIGGVANGVVSLANNVVRGGVKKASNLLLGGTERVLSRALPPRHNRDKPTELRNQALHVRATTNIASGSGEFAADSLRLQATGLTPHPDFLMGVERFDSIESIIETFGFVNAFEFNVRNIAEDLLCTIDTMLCPTETMQIGNKYPRGMSEWAPVDHMAGWFMNHHGQIEFKFECVADGFKTARMLVAYLPNGPEAPTYKQARSGYFVTFDLGASLNTQQTFTFVVPYIHNYTNYPHQTADGVVNTAGRIYVFCESKIGANEGTVSNFDVLVSKRAVPGTMALAIPTMNASRFIAPTPSFTRMKLTLGRLAPETLLVGLEIPGSTGAALTLTVGRAPIPEVFGLIDAVRVTSIDNALTWRNTGGRTFVIDIGRQYVNTILVSFSLVFMFDGGTTVLTYPMEGSFREYDLFFDIYGTSPGFVPTPNPGLALEDEVTETRPQMDARNDPIDEQRVAKPIEVLHEALIGESHMNLQDNLRRFEQWSVHELNVAASTQSGFLTIPCNFGSATFREDTPRIWTSNKILHLHDAMRFTRGSLRYVISVAASEKGIIRIQHVPQALQYPLDVNAQHAPFQYTRTGYGETILSIQQNNISTVEIPMYNPNSAILNASFLSTEQAVQYAQGLGVLKFYWTGPASHLRLDILRAFGDDTQMYCFTGFPIRSRTVPPETSPFYEPPALAVHPKIIETKPQMFNGVEEAATNLKSTAASLDAITKMIENFLSSVGDFDRPSEIISTLVLQVAHVIKNPNLPTFALSMGQILVSMRVLKFSVLEKIQGFFGTMWDWISDNVIPQIPCMQGGVIDEISNFSGFLFAGVAGLLGAKKKNLGTIESISFAFSAGPVQQRIAEFVKTLLGYVKRCAIAICEKACPDSRLYRLLTEDSISDWMNAVNVLCDDTIDSEINGNEKAIAVVYKTCSDGEQILIDLGNASRPPMALIANVRTAVDRIRKLRDKMAIQVSRPIVNYNPYCYWLSGSSSIGKSYILEQVSIFLYNQVIGPCNGDPIYVVPTSEYWEAYEYQPIIHFDDFGRVTPKDVIESNEARLCDLKSGTNYEIPFAFGKKGRVSRTILIGCASNHCHLEPNGIKAEVVNNRRNILYEVTADFRHFKTCAAHATIQLHCTACKAAVDDDGVPNLARLQRFQHLTFTRKSTTKEVELAPQPGLSFDEFKVEILNDFRTYHEMQMNDIESQRERNSTFNRPRTDTLSPVAPYIELAQRLTRNEYDDIVANLGGLRNVMPQRPQMMRTFRSFLRLTPREDEYEEEIDVWERSPIDPKNRPKGYHTRTSCGHAEVGLDTKIEFYDGYYTFPDLGVTNEQCCPQCSWPYAEKSILRAIGKQYRDQKQVPPPWFPPQYDLTYEWRQQEYADSLSRYYQTCPLTTWEKTKTLVKLLAIATTCIGFYEIAKMATRAVVNTVKSSFTHPCLMASADVKTNFLHRFKTQMRTRKPITKTKARMGTNIDEFVERYRQSLLMFTSHDEAYKVVSVCIAPGLYVTQLHSICSIILKASQAWEQQVREEGLGLPLLENDNKRIHAMFKIKVSTGACSRDLDLPEFMDSIKGVLGTDESGSDMALFSWHCQDLQTKNINNWMFDSEHDDLSLEDMHVIDWKADRNGIKELKTVTEVEEVLQYEASSSKTWCGEEKAVRVNLIGFRTDNPLNGKEAGMCGSILFDATIGKAVGIMSAGLGKYLHFNAFYKNVFKDAVIAHNLSFNSQTAVLIREKSKKINLESIEEQVGDLNSIPRMKVHHSTKSTLRKSVCHEVFGPVLRAPCNLSQGGDKGQTAIVNGLKHYAPHKPFPKRHVEVAYEHLNHMFVSYALPADKPTSKRTLNEAVCGVEGKIPRITMSTGVGFPWSTNPRTSRKSQLLGFDQNHQLTSIHEDLLNTITSEERDMERGRVPVTIFQIAAKDERLKLDKLDNVRLIQGSPLSLTLSARKYLMDFNLAFQESRSLLKHRVGINPMSLEWDSMTRELLRNSNKICVGDYSKFGPRLDNDFIEKSYAIMANWYDRWCEKNPKHRLAREILGQRVINSYNICYDQVIQLKCGSPSGAMNTVIVNSMCGLFYIACAWLGIMEEHRPEISGLNNFDDYVVFYDYGDDVIFSVADSICEVFNNQTIHEYFAKFDVKYTDVMKDGTMRKWCSIEEATFLKFGFKKFTETAIPGGVWVCVPNEGDLYDTCNWVRKPKGQRGGQYVEKILCLGALDNCDDAVRKMWFHGREKFDKFQKDVIAFWQNFEDGQYVPRIYSFEELQLSYGIPLITQTTWDQANAYRDHVALNPRYINEINERDKTAGNDPLTTASKVNPVEASVVPGAGTRNVNPQNYDPWQEHGYFMTERQRQFQASLDIGDYNITKTDTDSTPLTEDED